ncbi:MAG: M43 family zinc metalloprotease, partial [Spirosomataceae bacterium]
MFKSINVQFYLLPDIDYIDNTNYYDLNADQEEESLCRDNDVSNAVNLYVTNSIVFTYGFNAAGYAYYPSPIAASNRIFITNSSIISGGRTLTHEFGHYFNLLHTFRGNQNNDVTTRELVTRGNGANCTTTGDFLCDTPADPYGMSGATVNGCSYTGTLTDANGMQFAPQMTNTMS